MFINFTNSVNSLTLTFFSLKSEIIQFYDIMSGIDSNDPLSSKDNQSYKKRQIQIRQR